jgi:hypothetical protein
MIGIILYINVDVADFSPQSEADSPICNLRVLALQLRVESMEPETLWLEILGMK